MTLINTQDLIALLTIHVMDSSSNRGADEDEGRGSLRDFCSLDQWQKTLTKGAGGLGGSVSMATSQLGNHCKSKREGDIKGMNDEEKKRGWREMRGGR